ncbi:hypothetical protein BG006_008689 [Podila minutissima]|uniref:Bacteriophage T5 Orf172 DNA-binding domain-containing protein n=1 Tax=Podila minutissima TaxID=64525 RepID=A0A9P5VRP7_9FUNG|nr:hypothetical protein BG006_008689 [Podila minutissima]
MTNSASSNRSPSPDTSSSRCKAIAVSTGQRCTRSGKLDGYCSAKHKEQGEAKAGSNDDEEETKKKPAKKVVKKPSGDVAKVLKATTAKKAPAKRASATKAKKANKKAAGSDDEFEVSSDEDYSPSEDHSEVDSEDFDSEEEDDGVSGLTSKLKTVKIKPDDPTLPPRPADAPLSTKIQRVDTKIVNTNKLLPPPKSKTKPATDASVSTSAVGGFWVPAPAPVNIPESTRKALAAVKDKLKAELGTTTDVQHPAPEKKSSGFFSYRVHIQNFLKIDDKEDDQNNQDSSDNKDLSKRAQLKQFFGKLLLRTSKHSDVEAHDAPDKPAKEERPLPALPAPPKKAPKHRRGSQGSVGSVDSITQGILDLTVKPQESTDEFPNQCQGFNSNGYRCKRKVKLDRPVEDGEVLLCHDHEVEDDEVVVHIEGQGGVLLQWLDVSVWVNPHLPDYVQTKLRRAMEKPVSDTDKPGYIYTYQLLETRQNKTHTFFKVGRTDNVHRRMNEWSDKCGSSPILIEVFPEQGDLAPKSESDLADSPTDDKDLTGLRCRYAHRVERLIHIELKPFHDKDHVCSCKTAHREWFMVPHKAGLKGSQQMDQAWEQIRRVIVHWMAYMERVYGPG